MDTLTNDSRNIDLSEEAVFKSDKDLITIQSLNNLAKKTGNILVLHGGYATEAHCGGQITRAHGDIDAHLILTGNTSTKELSTEIQELVKKEDTEWILRSEKPDKIEYIENNDDKDFFDRRRLEVGLHQPHERNINYPLKTLIDSKGNKIEIHVIDLTELIANKIYKLYEVKSGVDETKDRHTSKTDLIDLKRLVETNDHNKSSIIEFLTTWITTVDKVSDKEGKEKATDMYNFALNTITKFNSPKL